MNIVELRKESIMEKLEIHQPLSNLQLELLKLYSQSVSDADLIAIKQLLARYFAEKAMDLADKIWDKKGWTEKDSRRLANTRMRTPYKPENE